MSLLLDNFFAPFTSPFGLIDRPTPRSHRLHRYRHHHHHRPVDPLFDIPSPTDILEEWLSPNSASIFTPFYEAVKQLENEDVEMTDEEGSEPSTPASEPAPPSAAQEQTQVQTPTPASAPQPEASAPQPEASQPDVKMSDEPEEENAEYVDLTKEDKPACAALSTAEVLAQQQQEQQQKEEHAEEGKVNNEPQSASPSSSSNEMSVAEPKTNSLLSLHRSVKYTADDKNLIISADFADIPKENITVEYNNGYLTIKAQNKVEKWNKKKGHYMAKSESFSRSFHIGRNVDPATIQASYNNGNFQVTIPKPRSAPAVQAITIN